VLDLIALAERDLLQSQRNLAECSFDWSLAVSYNCILQTARAWMFFKGFRPAFGEGHVPVISFAISTLESSFGKIPIRKTAFLIISDKALVGFILPILQSILLMAEIGFPVDSFS
jgi:hypothetical protein